MKTAPSHMRVPRTRSLALLGALTAFARSPLTRRPLGTQGLVLAAVLAASVLLAGCDHHSPTQPRESSLTGTWTATLSSSPCTGGDWSHIVLTLQQSGNVLAGNVTTA